jgi:MFS family permease
MALTAAIPMLFGVATGRWTDRIGSRKPLLVSAVLVSAAIVLPAVVPGIWPLFVTAAVGGTGMMAGQVALQNAVGSGSDIERRAENFSHMALGMSISTFAGPLVSGLSIDHLGFRWAFALLAVFPLISLIGLSRPSLRVPPPSPHAEAHSDRNVLDLLGTRDLRRVYIASCLLAMGWDLHAFIVPVLGTQLGLSASQIGAILSVFAAAIFVIRIVMRWIVRRFREWEILTTSMFVAGATYLLFPFAGSGLHLAVLSFVLGLALGAGQPVIMALMHHITPAGRAGEALGLRTTLMNTSQVALPLMFGAVSASVGMTTVFWSVAIGLGAGGYLTRRR